MSASPETQLCDFEDCDQAPTWLHDGGQAFCSYHAADAALQVLVSDDRGQGSSERRWGVMVRCYYKGKLSDGCPFLAGRFYFNLHGDSRTAEEHSPTATFLTREQARRRCIKIRTHLLHRDTSWTVTAKAVRVVVTTRLEHGS